MNAEEARRRVDRILRLDPREGLGYAVHFRLDKDREGSPMFAAVLVFGERQLFAVLGETVHAALDALESVVVAHIREQMDGMGERLAAAAREREASTRSGATRTTSTRTKSTRKTAD